MHREMMGKTFPAVYIAACKWTTTFRPPWLQLELHCSKYLGSKSAPLILFWPVYMTPSCILVKMFKGADLLP